MQNIKQRNNLFRGQKGEDIAVRYLQQKGYRILHRNWHFGHKELDIVAELDQLLVVVEVKTRTDDYWQLPYEAVSLKKQRAIIEAADAYVSRFNIDREVRFDIVAVVLKGSDATVEHIEDAFYPIL